MWLTIPVIFGALAGLTSVILVMMLAQSRIFYSMSRDGLLPPPFRACHPEWKTPVFSTVLTGIGAGLMGGLLPIDVLGELVSIGTLLAFVTVCIGVMVLRVTKPELPRPFRVQWPWFVGIGGALFCGADARQPVHDRRHLVPDRRSGRSSAFADLLRLRLQAQRAAQWRRLQSTRPSRRGQVSPATK